MTALSRSLLALSLSALVSTAMGAVPQPGATDNAASWSIAAGGAATRSRCLRCRSRVRPRSLRADGRFAIPDAWYARHAARQDQASRDIRRRK